MGLIKAALGSFNGSMADTWKEFFTCDSLASNVLITRGIKQTSKRSSNTKGSDNVITDGTGIAVADGQCMIVTEQGKIVDVCSEPGQYTFKSDIAPTIFCGNLGEGIKKTFSEMAKRFTMGGDTGKDQRIYYVNIKEIVGNKFGTATPVPFRVVDRNIGLDIDLSVRCNGVYSFRICDPIKFYTSLSGNIASDYTLSEIEGQLKTEFVSALQPAFAEISAQQVRPYELPAHTERLSVYLNNALDAKWGEIRGLEVVSVGLNSVTLPEEDSEILKTAQKNAILRDPTMAAATISGAQADAMKSAASNPNGAMNGFVGMGMAMNAGGANPANLFAMGAQQPAQPSNSWTCACGTTNSGNFCTNCGKPKPSESGWTCACGVANSGNFCTNCGKPKPSGDWTCTCGTTNSGNFCTNCGKPKA